MLWYKKYVCGAIYVNVAENVSSDAHDSIQIKVLDMIYAPNFIQLTFGQALIRIQSGDVLIDVWN
jgi:hypothetical protein